MFNRKLKKELDVIKEAMADIATNTTSISERVDELENTLISLNKVADELNHFKKNLTPVIEEYSEAAIRKNSDEPYFEVLSTSFSKEKGVQMKFDWNNAMVNYLRSNGYNEIDDADVIEKYISDVFKSVGQNG